MKISLAIVAADSNEKGDLLGRLVVDFFYCLGYDDCKLNIPKSGREIDLKARHRREPRLVVAECKATSAPIGGADVNKFAGVLGAERDKADGADVRGYFISLSGFTSSAIQQEEDLKRSRLTLINGSELVEELVRGKFVVPATKAQLSAVKALSDSSPEVEVQDNAALLGTTTGWFWLLDILVGSTQGALLVHADGSVVSATVAAETWAAFARNYPSESRTLLNKLVSQPADLESSQREYLQYIVRDFGGITLEGLPATRQVGSRRFRLEDLYVPLTLSEAADETDEQVQEESPMRDLLTISRGSRGRKRSTTRSMSLGEALIKHPRLAIVGLPGSGKSTIIKRLAVAYAERSRIRESRDKLPDQPLFPVVIRCREVSKPSRSSIVTMIADQVDRAEVPTARDAFIRMLTAELNEGRVLLLIDGLDEFQSTQDRASFVAQLRTFLSTYPTCQVVL
ncbi:NACHT domain-containing protein, partial [Micromonospora andamanensis]